jgi:endonuclease V-like protein UPF0215 family
MGSTVRSSRFTLAVTLAAVATIVVTLAGAPAGAATLAARTFLASFGNDANSCTTPQDPCRDFNAALDKTAAGGQLSILDGGPYGAPMVDKSITVDGESAHGVVVLMTLNVVVGDADIVVLRGLVLGGGFSSSFIRFAGTGTLQVEGCVVDGTNNGHGGATGIHIEPRGPSRVFVADTVVRNLLTNDAHALRLLAPDRGPTVVTLERVRFEHNVSGIAVVAHEGDVERVQITLRESVIAQHENNGIEVASNQARGSVDVLVENTALAANARVGVSCGGGSGRVRLRNTTVTHNGVGISGSVFSYGDNTIDENDTDGTPASLLSQT